MKQKNGVIALYLFQSQMERLNYASTLHLMYISQINKCKVFDS